jgi:hypothetical protein
MAAVPEFSDDAEDHLIAIETAHRQPTDMNLHWSSPDIEIPAVSCSGKYPNANCWSGA